MSKKSSKSIRERLERARKTQQPVRVYRYIREVEPFECFVAAISRRWILLQRLDDALAPDGFACVRIADVNRVRPHPSGSVPRRLLETRGRWPLVSPVIPPLDVTEELLRSVALDWPTVTLFVERDDPEVCFIGAVIEVTKKRVEMQEINPEAEWDDTISLFPFRDITRVDFGCAYEAALVEVGGTPFTPVADPH